MNDVRSRFFVAGLFVASLFLAIAFVAVTELYNIAHSLAIIASPP